VQLSGLPPSSRLLANILCLFTPDLRILDGGLPTKVQSVPVLPWPQDNASSVQIRSASGLLGRAKHSVQNFIFLRYSPNAQRCHFRVANKIPEVSTLAGPLYSRLAIRPEVLYVQYISYFKDYVIKNRFQVSVKK